MCRQTGIAGNRLMCAGGTTTQHYASCTVTYPAIGHNLLNKKVQWWKLTFPRQDCSPGGHGWLCASWCFYPWVPRPSPAETDGWSASAWSPRCLRPRWSILGSHPEVATKTTKRSIKTRRNLKIGRQASSLKSYLRWFSESSWTSTWPCLPWASLQCFQGSLKKPV